MDMGEPVKLIELARTMIRLAGHREGEIVTVLTQEVEARASPGCPR